MEVDLLWMRPNAQLIALRGGLRFLRLAEFVRYNWAANANEFTRIKLSRLKLLRPNPVSTLLAFHQSGSQWNDSQSYRTNPQGHQVDV